MCLFGDKSLLISNPAVRLNGCVKLKWQWRQVTLTFPHLGDLNGAVPMPSERTGVDFKCGLWGTNYMSLNTNAGGVRERRAQNSSGGWWQLGNENTVIWERNEKKHSRWGRLKREWSEMKVTGRDVRIGGEEWAYEMWISSVIKNGDWEIEFEVLK